MNAGEDVRLAGVARVLGAWWRALAALAALGALVGFLLSFVLSPGQQASSKVVLHGQLDKNQLLTQTQIATSLAVLDPVATALGGTGVELRDRVSAEVLDGNVLRITGTGPTAEEARALTDQVANGYVRFSAQVVAQTKDAAEAAVAQRREAAQRNLDDLKAQMAQAQRAEEPDRALLGRLGTAIAAAEAEISRLDQQAARESSELSIPGEAEVLERAIPEGAAQPSPLVLVLGGAVVFALLGAGALVWRATRPGPLTDPDDVAAALGAPVLAALAVEERPEPELLREEGRFHRWLQHLKSPEAAPAALDPRSAGETTRYRRLLARLGSADGRPIRLLLVLVDDDRAAHRAAEELAVTAAEHGAVAVVTDDIWDADQYTSAIGEHDRITVVTAEEQERSGTAAAEPIQLRITHVAPARPTVPDCAAADGVLVLVEEGSRTAAELIDIGGACVDAGHPVTGAALVSVVRPPAPEEPPGGEAVQERDDELVVGSS